MVANPESEADPASDPTPVRESSTAPRPVTASLTSELPELPEAEVVTQQAARPAGPVVAAPPPAGAEPAAAPLGLGGGVGGPAEAAPTSALVRPDQILTRLEIMARDGGGTAVLELDPPALGRLHVALNVAANGATTLHVIAGTLEARAMLLAQLDDLRAAFAQSGLHIEDVTVELADSRSAGAQTDGDAGTSEEPGIAADDDPTDLSIAEALAEAGRAGHRIDYRA